MPYLAVNNIVVCLFLTKISKSLTFSCMILATKQPKSVSRYLNFKGSAPICVRYAKRKRTNSSHAERYVPLLYCNFSVTFWFCIKPSAVLNNIMRISILPRFCMNSSILFVSFSKLGTSLQLKNNLSPRFQHPPHFSFGKR